MFSSGLQDWTDADEFNRYRERRGGSEIMDSPSAHGDTMSEASRRRKSLRVTNRSLKSNKSDKSVCSEGSGGNLQRPRTDRPVPSASSVCSEDSGRRLRRIINQPLVRSISGTHGYIRINERYRWIKPHRYSLNGVVSRNL